MYSLMVPGGEAPSQVTKQDWSFCKHVIATQTAMERHAGSFGQLVALKIRVTPGQLPASGVVVTGVVGVVPASRDGAIMPPPGEAPLQGTPLTGVHAPSCGGLPSGGEGDEDEQATNAAIATACDA